MVAGTNDDTRYLIPALAPVYERLDKLAWPLIRVMYGFFFIPHGCQKILGWFHGNIAGTMKFMDNVGIEPAWFWAHYIGSLELVGGTLIALGLLTRPVAALMTGFMAVGIYAHWQFGYFWTGKGFSIPLLLFVLGLAIVIRGGGDFSLDRRFNREV